MWVQLGQGGIWLVLLLSLLQIYCLLTECLLNDGSVGIVGLRKGSWALRWAVGRI